MLIMSVEAFALTGNVVRASFAVGVSSFLGKTIMENLSLYLGTRTSNPQTGKEKKSSSHNQQKVKVIHWLRQRLEVMVLRIIR